MAGGRNWGAGSAAEDDDDAVSPLSAPHPAWFDDLLTGVGQAFEVTGAETPGWSDPHPDRNPSAAEYSRCLDPAKYRILQTRIDAWVRVLVSRGTATSDTVSPTAWTGAVRRPDGWRRVRRLAPLRAGSLGVLLGETVVDGEPFGIDVGMFDPSDASQVFLDTIPDCGCDACDSGSDDLLAVLDGWILSVARGGVVHARSASSYVSRTIDGWQGAGDERALETWLDEDVTVPPGVRRWVGEPWA